MSRQLKLTAIGLGIIVLVVLFFVMGRPAENKVETPVPLDESTIQFVRPTVVGMTDGVRQWQLETDIMREQDELIYLEQIERGVLYRDGEKYLTFVADAGIWNQKRDELDLIGNVVVFRDDERLLDSDRLLWNGRSEILSSPGPVEIRIDGNTIMADEMIGNVSKDELVFQGNVQVTSDRIVLSVPDRLIYHVEDESMEGFGQGALRFN